MPFRPISRDDLDARIREGLEDADEEAVAAWATMRMEPEKWQCSPWGDAGGGFWVVAVREGNVVWFNDIEGGFNTSPIERWGVIGEYWCNQTDFSELLATLPEGAPASWPVGVDLGVPPELSGKGQIVKVQRASWTVHAEHGDRWRVRHRGTVETHWECADYTSIELCSEHPLLQQYNEHWVHLYFNGRPTKLVECEAAMSLAVERATGGWRSIQSYRNAGAELGDGWGQLLHAPESVAEAVQLELERHGLACSRLGNTPVPSKKKVLLMGRSFIVAEEFRFDRVDG